MYWTILVIGFINLLLSIFGLIKIRKDNFLKPHFLLFAFTTCLWVFSNYFGFTYSHVFLFFQISYSLGALAISTATALIFTFANQSKLPKSKFILIHGLGLFFFASCYINGFLFKYSPTHIFKDYFTPLFSLYSVYLFLSIVVWLAKLYRCSRELEGIQKQQARYIIMGVLGAGGAAFIVSCILPILGYMQFFMLDTSGTLIFVGCTVYAIAKYRLMDVRVAITRASMVFTISIGVLVIPFYIGFRTHEWSHATALAVILAMLGQSAYRFLHRKAEDILLAEQREYQNIILQVANGMLKVHDKNNLSKLIVFLIKRTVKPSFVSIFVFDKEKDVYSLKASKSNNEPNPNQNDILPLETMPLSNSLIAFLADKNEPILFEEIPENIRCSVIIPFRIVLIMPSVVREAPLGYIFMGEKLNKKHYSNDDINVFNILAKQASIAMENCIFMEEFKDAQEKIYTAEKLASIGGLAEGMAHQINNRLTHLFINLEELEFQKEDLMKSYPQSLLNDPEFKIKMENLDITAKSLMANSKRIDGIVKGLLGYARAEAKETYFSIFSLHEVIDLSIDLLKIKYELHNFPLDIEMKCSDSVFGVKAQLLETIYNVLDNAYEAALDKKPHLSPQEAEAFIPAIQLKLTQTDAYSLVDISDNGIGIKEEDKHKMFVPFFTTKSTSRSGTGIGMYVVKRIIEENHHGKVWFESVHGKGTHIFLKIPKPMDAVELKD